MKSTDYLASLTEEEIEKLKKHKKGRYLLMVQTLCSTIERARKSKGISQRQLARKAKVTQAYISKIESGEVTPNLRTLFNMMDILDKELIVKFK